MYLVYRSTDISSRGSEGRYINSLGYAASSDGIHFNRLCDPILGNDVPQEARGPRRPAHRQMGDTFYMMYTGLRRTFRWRLPHLLRHVTNLIDWQRHGVMLDEPNKDASLFPEKIDGHYVMFHRRDTGIWLANSDDLKDWYNHRLIAVPFHSALGNVKIGIAGPPIKTPDGWLLIYHGVARARATVWEPCCSIR